MWIKLRIAVARSILVIASMLMTPTVSIAGAESGKVPDLLDLPAPADHGARRSLLLGVSRAGDRLVAVGVRGVVLLSDDAGRSWRQARTVPVSVALTDVHFASANEGWAVGHSGVVLHSADGGETWTCQLDGNQAAALVLEEARARLAAAGDDGAARELRDAERLVEEGPDKPLLGVHFIDARRGFAVGAYGLAFATADGGRSWQSVMWRIPNPRGKHLYQVQADGSDVLIAGEQGVLFRSTDGGASFQRLATPYAGTFFGALPLGANGLLAYGLRGNAWYSEDAGANWRRIDLAQPVTLTATLQLADGALLLADESGRLLRGDPAATRFVPLAVPLPTGLTGMTQAADGALVVSGARGLSRIEPASLTGDATK